MEVEALAARDDGRRDLVWFRGSQHEDNVWGWLFQCFEQRIERRIGEHVNFVNDIKLDTGLAGSKTHFLTQVTNVIYTGIQTGWSREINILLSSK